MPPAAASVFSHLRATLLSVSNVGASFGATELFKNVTFSSAAAQEGPWIIVGHEADHRVGSILARTTRAGAP